MKTNLSKLIVTKCGPVVCLLLALSCLAVAAWLFANGRFPYFTAGQNTLVQFDGLSINGFKLPSWTFYFIPCGLCLAAGGLFLLARALMDRRMGTRL